MAAKKPNQNGNGEQLNLFSTNQNHYDHSHTNTTDPIRTDGGEALAGISPEDGRRNGSEGRPSGDAAGGGGANGGRDARPDHEVSAARLDGATGARPGLGNGAGGIHPVAARSERVVRNQNNYRIADADGVGAGSPKEKCRANLAAIKLVRKLQAERRPSTAEEKSVLVRY